MLHKAVFLDRDGVINRDIGDYTFKPEEFILLNDVTAALKIFQDKGYLLIIITNQGGIGKKMYGHNEVKVLHEMLAGWLKKENIFLTDIYYCPHHPISSNCICRKPGSLLLEKAIARYLIDPELSYFIGDMDRDIEAGTAAGVTPVKIETNSSLLQVAAMIR